MSANKLTSIIELLAQYDHVSDGGSALCAVAVDLTGMTGSAIVLSSAGLVVTPFCTRDHDVTSSLRDLEVTLGEGPRINTCSSVGMVGESVLVPSSVDQCEIYEPLAVKSGYPRQSWHENWSASHPLTSQSLRRPA